MAGNGSPFKDFAAYDHGAQRMYEIFNTAILGFDALSGATLFTTIPSTTLEQIQNPAVDASGQVLILHRIPGATGVKTARLDPMLGEITDLAPLPPGLTLFQSPAAVDRSANRIYHLAGNVVITVEGGTGAVLAVATIANGGFQSPVVNRAGEIIGVDVSVSPSHFARLDPATGAVTDLAPYTGGVQGNVAYDPCTDHIYQSDEHDNLYTIDGTTGAILGYVALPRYIGSFQAVW
jgi:hypothetical protein